MMREAKRLLARMREMITSDEYEAATIERALAGDAEAGREALDLCITGLYAGRISERLAHYVAGRLQLVLDALKDADRLRGVKKSSGSVRSARDGAIADALCINRSTGRPSDPIPDWQTQLAAIGVYLRRKNVRAERAYAAMSQARESIANKTLERREAQRVVKAHGPLWKHSDESLIRLAGPVLREIAPTFLPQTKKR